MRWARSFDDHLIDGEVSPSRIVSEYSTSPFSGGVKPANTCTSVVLPEPFSPVITVEYPSGACMVRGGPKRVSTSCVATAAGTPRGTFFAGGRAGASGSSSALMRERPVWSRR